jgi:DNA-binding response OmpR family regulator
MGIRKILIVDDEKPIHSYLQKKLTKLGYTALTAENGEEAIEKAFHFGPDLILLDVKLPKLNGIEVCKRLKSAEKTRDIPIIMLSARAQSSEIRKGMEAGADKYLCKPVGFPDILREIQAYETT